MMDLTLHQVRATGILIENDEILLVRQKVNQDRGWSLPGGKKEKNELLDQAVVRKILEETGLDVQVENCCTFVMFLKAKYLSFMYRFCCAGWVAVSKCLQTSWNIIRSAT